jgi:hypothetical protein
MMDGPNPDTEPPMSLRKATRWGHEPPLSELTMDALTPRASGAGYALDHWEQEAFANFGEGRSPSPCPECGRTGFYGPRLDAAERRYRQCRFCGFTQAVGEPPVRCQAIVHGCADWPWCARAPYLWWVEPGVDSCDCPFCRKPVDVGAVEVLRPVEDEEHPWWRVPQNRSRFYYSRFWSNWAVTNGRVFL